MLLKISLISLNNFLFTSPVKEKGMKKLERSKALKREDGVDFISSMPDAVLVLILSRLEYAQEAIQCSVLSRRWRYLWTSIPSLDINCFREGRYRGNFKKNKFKEFVYGVLANTSVDLDRLDLCCLDHYSMSTVGMWIHVAVMRNIKQLYLKFRPKEETQDIELPHCLVACAALKVLSLDLGFRVLRLRNVTGFIGLKVLRLICVDLLDHGDVVKDFFQSCPLLEGLSLSDCLIHRLGLLCISCPQLKKLFIRKSEDDEGDMCRGIKICCPKPVFLALTGHLAYNFFFEYLDSLKETEIDPKLLGNTSSVLAAISHVECLKINLYFFGQCINAARDPALPNLKTLMLTTTMDAFTMDNFNRVLKHYPKLESLKLIIEQDFKREVHEGVDARSVFTPDLKRVEFFNFNGEKPKLAIDMDDMVWLEA